MRRLGPTIIQWSKTLLIHFNIRREASNRKQHARPTELSFGKWEHQTRFVFERKRFCVLRKTPRSQQKCNCCLCLVASTWLDFSDTLSTHDISWAFIIFPRKWVRLFPDNLQSGGKGSASDICLFFCTLSKWTQKTLATGFWNVRQAGWVA